MQQTRIHRPRARREHRWQEVLPPDPRDPDVVHAKALARAGAAGATVAGVAWARSSLGSTFGDFPVPDLLAVLVGLPLVAVVGGWLLVGRPPQVIARQPLE